LQRYLMSTTSLNREELFTLGTMVKSDSGQTYKIEEVLAERRKPLLCVYLARCVYLIWGAWDIFANRLLKAPRGGNTL
jgi:hypothetical protein